MLDSQNFMRVCLQTRELWAPAIEFTKLGSRGLDLSCHSHEIDKGSGTFSIPKCPREIFIFGIKV